MQVHYPRTCGWYARGVTDDMEHRAEGTAGVADEDAIRGARFVTKFEERAHMHRLHPLRLWRLVLGLGLLIFGIINIFIPGPGGSVIILASLLVLSGESRLLARLLDWAEVKFQRQVDWAMRHKIATLFLVSGSAFVFTVSMTFLYAKLH